MNDVGVEIIKDIENFDEYWGKIGDPKKVEEAFREILPATKNRDKSLYLQVLSQIALSQALQRNFEKAHGTIAQAESEMTPEQHLAKTRVILEKGRVFQQQEKLKEAMHSFLEAYEYGKKYGFDRYTIDAAHMIAIITPDLKDKIYWNELAILDSENTTDSKTKAWIVSLQNNLAQNFIEAKRYDEALVLFQKALEGRIKEGYELNIRAAKIFVGSALRYLNRLDEALDIQLSLLKEFEQSEAENIMSQLLQGFLNEELAEIYSSKSAQHSEKSLKLFEKSQDPIFIGSIRKKILRLNELKSIGFNQKETDI